MPNTLAHIGVGVVATRALRRDAPLAWIALGVVIPDLPWIALRALQAAAPGVDPYALRLYAVAQCSLVVSLLLCGACAALARRPGAVFAILSGNALLHLLLDACQTKWGNGVHLLAPFSWELWNWGLFWPESLPTYALTALGLGAAAWALARAVRGEAGAIGLRARPPLRVALAGALLAAWLGAPLALRGGPDAADSHSVRTLRERADRPGRAVALDRSDAGRDGTGTWAAAFGGERLRLVGALPETPAQVSLRGRFRDRATVEVEQLHVHRGWPRDLASYAGLAAVAGLWAVGLAREARERRA